MNNSIRLKINGVSGEEYSSQELRSSCLRVASGLRRLGLRQGETLSVHSDNSIEFVIMVLGTLAAGGIVNTVNSNFKEGENKLIKYDSTVLCVTVYCCYCFICPWLGHAGFIGLTCTSISMRYSLKPFPDGGIGKKRRILL